MPYYSKYDDLYRSFYAKGYRDWWYGPDSEHKTALLNRLISRIREVRPDPQGAKVIELGCGEAPWATGFARLGMKYLGVDYSTHAIARAREIVHEPELDVEFRVMDALHLDEDIMRSKYDIVFDNRCLQMFVIDDDRRQYLSNVNRILDEDGAYILTEVSADEDANGGEIHNIEQYQRIHEEDLSELREWEAWDGKNWVFTKLPRFACRVKSRQGYINEMVAAGFRVKRVYDNASAEGQRVSAFDFILTL